MVDIHIEYFQGCFDEKDIEEIKQLHTSYDVNVETHERKPTIINAALDELVGDILLFINSNELQTFISIFNIAESLAVVVKWMWNKLKSNNPIKITSKTNEEKEVNIIIQVDNIKILLDRNTTEEELSKYLRIALRESKVVSQEKTNKPLVIDGDNNTVNVYYLEEFAKKTIGKEYKTIRSTAHRKNVRRK